SKEIGLAVGIINRAKYRIANVDKKKLKQSSIKIKRAPTSIQQSTTQNNSSKISSVVHPFLTSSGILPSLDLSLS
ncbi:unnamed protein product, partial [Rotaria sordida]